jgi:hypothetical protein
VNENPPRAWVRAPAERGSEIPRGDLWVGGWEVRHEDAFNATLFINALQANGPLTVRQPLRRSCASMRIPPRAMWHGHEVAVGEFRAEYALRPDYSKAGRQCELGLPQGPRYFVCSCRRRR